MTYPQLGLDTQCLSYLIDGISGITPPLDSLAAQRIALLRLYFYLPGTLWTTRTVAEECARIRCTTREEHHGSFLRTLFGVLPCDAKAVGVRQAELMPFHKSVNDCRILAEAEQVQHGVLLTYDAKLIRNLGSRTTISLVQPEQYWLSLEIPSGAPPCKVPAADNPLSQQAWWRW